VRRRELLVLLLALLTSACTPEQASPPADAAASGDQAAKDGDADDAADAAAESKAKRDWKSEYKRMDAALDLADDEANAVQAALRAGDEAIAQWQAENGAKLSELERQMFAAAKARDLPGMQKFTAQAGPLRNEFRALVAQQLANIHDALSPENRHRWEGHLLAERVIEMMQPLDLNAEQIAEIRERAVTVAKAASKEINPQAAGYLVLEKSIESSVLSPIQRKAFEAVKKKHPIRSLRRR